MDQLRQRIKERRERTKELEDAVDQAARELMGGNAVAAFAVLAPYASDDATKKNPPEAEPGKPREASATSAPAAAAVPAPAASDKSGGGGAGQGREPRRTNRPRARRSRSSSWLW